MPLHLLPNKSWHVYNSENVARVRTDEAKAAAVEAAEEQRLQEEDAVRRLAILRGEEPPPPSRPAELPDPSAHPNKSRHDGTKGNEDKVRSRHPRKRHGEDDTDFELRLALERREQTSSSHENLQLSSTGNAPIIDGRGNISLFPIDPSCKPTKPLKPPNPEAEADKQKQREHDDPTLRFSHASGRDQSLLSKTAPWYKTSAPEVDALVQSGGTNAFGKPDPERQARDAKRLHLADPLALMKQGAKRVREVKNERDKEHEERKSAISRLKKEERRERREIRRARKEKRRKGEPVDYISDEDGLEGFSLDPREPDKNERSSSHGDKDVGRHGHRDSHHDRNRHYRDSIHRSKSRRRGV